MGLKDLFLNLGQTIELLLTMAPSIDSKLLVLFAGIILGYLEMDGLASPADHTQNLDSLEKILEAIITVVTIISYFVHNAVVQKNKLKYGPAQPIDPATEGPGMWQIIKNFMFKQQANQTQPAAVPNGPTQ